jgi:hypothetical protein
MSDQQISHRYSKEGYKDKYFDNEKQMLDFLRKYENCIYKYNMNAVNDFLNSVGIETQYPIVVLSEKDFDDAVLNSPNHLRISKGSMGEVQLLSRVILVRENTKLQETNGTLFTESLIVHEIAHRDSLMYTISKYDYSKNTVDVQEKRTGYSSRKQDQQNLHLVLEEGFAELIRAEFVSQHWDQFKLSQAYPMSNCFNLAECNCEGVKFLVPISSIMYNEKNLMQFLNPGKALTCLLLLSNNISEFNSLLREGRKSLDGLRIIIQKIESVDKGLYPKIRNTSYVDNIEINKLQSQIARLVGKIEFVKFLDN